MKTLILVATFATLALSAAAPLYAAGSSVNPLQPTEIAGRCDSKHDIKEHPRCTQP